MLSLKLYYLSLFTEQNFYYIRAITEGLLRKFISSYPVNDLIIVTPVSNFHTAMLTIIYARCVPEDYVNF
jgi:hypothetical protein